MINLTLSKADLFPNLKVTLLLESLTSGQFIASIREFPDCRIQAETKEIAIAQLQATFLERLPKIEAIAWEIPLQTIEPPWQEYVGIFQDDPDFTAVMESINAKKNSDDDSEVDSSYYLER